MRVIWKIGSDGLNQYHNGLNEYWSDLEIIPRVHDKVNIEELVSEEDGTKIIETSRVWSYPDATVTFVTLRKDDKGFYYEIVLECEDR